MQVKEEVVRGGSLGVTEEVVCAGRGGGGPVQDVEENAGDSGRWRRGDRDGRRTVLWTCRLLLHNAQWRVHALR